MKNSILIILLFACLGLKSQEIPFYSNYTINPIVYNPSYSGINNETESFIHQRTQWTGFKGSPVSHLFTLSSPISSINSGFGFSIQNDQRGLFNSITGSLKYAYHAKINVNSTLSFGLGVDINNRILRINESTVKDIDDPLLTNGSISETFLDASFGINYQFNSLNIGISIPQVLEGGDKNSDFNIKNTRYIIGQASYLFNVSKSNKIKIEPIVLTRYSANIPFQYDVNTLLHFKNMFHIGAGYRSNYAINFHLGIKYKNVQIAYMHDFANVNNYLNNGLSHEITLGYKFGISKQQPFINNLEVEEQEPLSSEKIKTILNLLIDEFFESGGNSPEEIKRIEIMKESIFNLLESMDKNK
ncbi:PorP/SprF family type IX secretion system membrane protein [Vicingus serpentipes]|nr:PorP/SprF family type IX secretion system membrane protein [Vicingus serpentipes]